MSRSFAWLKMCVRIIDTKVRLLCFVTFNTMQLAKNSVGFEMLILPHGYSHRFDVSLPAVQQPQICCASSNSATAADMLCLFQQCHCRRYVVSLPTVPLPKICCVSSNSATKAADLLTPTFSYLPVFPFLFWLPVTMLKSGVWILHQPSAIDLPSSVTRLGDF